MSLSRSSVVLLLVSYFGTTFSSSLAILVGLLGVLGLSMFV